MSLTVGANSYISVSDAASYFEARLHSAVWTSAADADKEAALMQSTRMLDELVNWIGVPTVEGQSLRWPRKPAVPRAVLNCFMPFPEFIGMDCKELRDRDNNPIAIDAIPQKLKDAVCEQAIYLLSLDPTQKPTLAQKGFSQASGAGLSITADKSMRADMLCQAAIAAIAGLGSPTGDATVDGASVSYLGRA